MVPETKPPNYGVDDEALDEMNPLLDVQWQDGLISAGQHRASVVKCKTGLSPGFSAVLPPLDVEVVGNSRRLEARTAAVYVMEDSGYAGVIPVRIVEAECCPIPCYHYAIIRVWTWARRVVRGGPIVTDASERSIGPRQGCGAKRRRIRGEFECWIHDPRRLEVIIQAKRRDNPGNGDEDTQNCLAYREIRDGAPDSVEPGRIRPQYIWPV